MSRQQRRAKLKESIAALSRRGINLDDPQSEQGWSMIALTRILMDILDGHSPTRASDAAKRTHEFFETSLARNPSDHKIECARGCAFCCHLRVTALAPEVLYMANFIRKQFGPELESVLARSRAADAKSRGLSAAERPKHKTPCGQLVDNACSVYAARPSACRGLTSISVKTCERGYNGEEVQVLTPAVWSEIRRADNQALWAALTAAGLPAHSYELNHALLVALETPDAERRWLNGEDIFAEVSCDRVDQGADAVNKQHLIATLIAGATGKEFPASP